MPAAASDAREEVGEAASAGDDVIELGERVELARHVELLASVIFQRGRGAHSG